MMFSTDQFSAVKTTTLVRQPCGARRERGAIGAVVVILFFSLMLLAGLVVDGGNAINGRQRVVDHAEQAARRGANQIDEAVLRDTGAVVINESAARTEARQFLADLGYTAAQVTVAVPPGTNEVTVTVSDTVNTELLSMIGIGSFPVEGEATARAAVGITGEI